MNILWVGNNKVIKLSKVVKVKRALSPDMHKKTVLKSIVQVTIFISLTLFFVFFYLKEQLKNYIEHRETITSRYEDADSLEFPTITLCLDPATKLSVSKKYGFTKYLDKFYKPVETSTLAQRFEELTYTLNKDFKVQFNGEYDLKVGLSKAQEYESTPVHKRPLQFDVQPIHTFNYGTCYKLEPKFDVTFAPIRIEFTVTLDPNLAVLDRPKSVVLHLTSNKTWLGLTDAIWPQFKPMTQIIHFEKEYTHIYAKVVQKHFHEGIEKDNMKCFDEMIVSNNCSYWCDILSYTNLPKCRSVEELQCTWDHMYANHARFTSCFRFKSATTYELQRRIENPFHAEVNTSFTTIYLAIWTMDKKIHEEVPLLTTEDLIGSIGGSLGMFFGFSISASFYYCIDKIFR